MSTPQNRFTASANRFALEIDGIGRIYATEATPPAKKQTPHKHQPGNQKSPEYGPGNYEIEEMSFKHATAKGTAEDDLAHWLDDYLEGDDGPRNGRFIRFDAAGRIPVKTWELINCHPVMYKPETHSGTSTEVSEFSFSIQPEEARLI